MAPRLRVLAGTSLDTMVPMTSLVNTKKAHRYSSELFEGEIVANIKGFTDPEGQVRDSEYFSREDRQGITWSIQVQGRFLNTYSADDILFGNTFDRPLKLPWGTSAALKFMHFIDPTLEHDLMSPTKPWALSPLISTMPHFSHTRISPPLDGHSCESSLSTSYQKPASISPPPFPPTTSMSDHTSQLYLAVPDSNSSHSSDSGSDTSSLSSASSILSSVPSPSSTTSRSSAKSKVASTGASKLRQAVKVARRKRTKPPNPDLSFDSANQRRSYFGAPSHRQAIQFGPEDVITTDFCYGFLEFSPSLALRLPGGLSFDLVRYWDGQPVRFICCKRKDASEGGGGDPWGTIFWCVSIEMVDDDHTRHDNEVNQM